LCVSHPPLHSFPTRRSSDLSNFDSTKVYPLVDYIYPVPGANVGQWGFIMPDVMEPRALAEVGFVVTQIMGRGTGSRSKAFLDVRSEEHTSELQSRFDLVCRL